MKRALSALKSLGAAFDAKDDPEQPAFDPVHLAAALILTLVAVGALYWTLWTLLVFEGGLFVKLVPAAQVVLRLKNPADFGYLGPWDRGIFEGWLGNLVALAVTLAAVKGLHGLYWSKARRSPR